MSTAQIGLLTGPIGIGKTTVAVRVVELMRQQGLTCGGLLAPAMLNSCGEKIGIMGVAVASGEHRILARTNQKLGGPSVGPYSFDAVALAWALETLTRDLGACDLLIVDEVGKLELWQGTGLAPLLPRLAAGTAPRSLVLVRDSLLEELRSKLGSTQQIVFTISQENRDEMPLQILGGMT